MMVKVYFLFDVLRTLSMDRDFLKFFASTLNMLTSTVHIFSLRKHVRAV